MFYMGKVVVKKYTVSTRLNENLFNLNIKY